MYKTLSQLSEEMSHQHCIDYFLNDVIGLIDYYDVYGVPLSYDTIHRRHCINEVDVAFFLIKFHGS
jgi:hypothetical protein